MPEVDIGARLVVSLDGLKASQDQLAAELGAARARAARRPTHARQTASVVIPAAGAAIIDLGGPTSGRLWQVRSIAVGGPTPLAAAGGTAFVFVAPTGAGLGGLSTAQWRDQTLTLPNAAFYGAEQLIVRTNEHLLIVIAGGTVGTNYQANACMEDWPDAVSSRELA